MYLSECPIDKGLQTMPGSHFPGIAYLNSQTKYQYNSLELQKFSLLCDFCLFLCPHTWKTGSVLIIIPQVPFTFF